MGPNFRDIHLNLDEVVGITIAETDEVAERMHTINTVLDRRPTTVTSMIIVPATPEGEVLTNDSITYIMSSIEAMVATRLRGIHDDVDGGEDATSGGILEDLIGKLEQQAWFLSSKIRHPMQ